MSSHTVWGNLSEAAPNSLTQKWELRPMGSPVLADAAEEPVLGAQDPPPIPLQGAVPKGWANPAAVSSFSGSGHPDPVEAEAIAVLVQPVDGAALAVEAPTRPPPGRQLGPPVEEAAAADEEAAAGDLAQSPWSSMSHLKSSLASSNLLWELSMGTGNGRPSQLSHWLSPTNLEHSSSSNNSITWSTASKSSALPTLLPLSSVGNLV